MPFLPWLTSFVDEFWKIHSSLSRDFGDPPRSGGAARVPPGALLPGDGRTSGGARGIRDPTRRAAQARRGGRAGQYAVADATGCAAEGPVGANTWRSIIASDSRCGTRISAP